MFSAFKPPADNRSAGEVESLASERIIVGGPRDVYELVGPELQVLDREVVKLLSLGPRSELIGCETISDGGVDMTLLRPREVFASALKNSATFIILVHNHPSGGPEPSESDIEVTKKLARIGRMLGVWLQDHVIIGDRGFVSLRARGIIGP